MAEKAERIDEVTKKEKKKFKAPHLLWIMVGLLLMAVVLTYIIPAGEYAVDSAGNIIQDEFRFLEEQTAVSVGSMLMLLMDGLVKSSTVIFTVMATGASISVLLKTRAIDKVLNWAVGKLEGSGTTPLISILFVIMTYIGGFAGSDALVAMVPIGVLFAKRLKLDPIVSLGLTLFPTMIGFGTGPTTAAIPQMLAGVQPYSGFFVRLLIMNVFMIVGLLYLLRYVKKIQNDPTQSPLYTKEYYEQYTQENVSLDDIEAKLDMNSVLTLIVFLGQFLFIVAYGMFGEGSILSFMTAANLVSATLMGLVNRMSLDEIGNTIGAGISAMAFVAFVIGLAGAFTLVLQEGNIMATIVYWATIPLMKIGGQLANIGIMIVVSILNFIIPSATSKAAILIPTIVPITSAIGIPAQAAVQSFMLGNGFTILISPVLGWTLGSLETANVPYDKWLKWVTPAIVIFMVLSTILLYVLTSIGWA